MSRQQAQHGERGEIGGGNFPALKGEFNTITMKFADNVRNTKDGQIPILTTTFTIADGEHEESNIIHDFWLKVGDEKSELAMDTYLYYTGMRDRFCAEVPGDSYIDPQSIEWIKLNVINKPVRLNTRIETYKKDGEDKQVTRIKEFMKVTLNGVAGQPPQASGPSTGPAIV